jgi:hypothetical protein
MALFSPYNPPSVFNSLVKYMLMVKHHSKINSKSYMLMLNDIKTQVEYIVW